jgi:hypothetical protein
MVPEISPRWNAIFGSKVHGSVCGAKIGGVGDDGGHCGEDWNCTCGEFVEGIGCGNCLGGRTEVRLEESGVLYDADVWGLKLAEHEESTFVGV